jgi:hypothetical protein
MAYVDWLIKGPKIASCNCDYGCPCEFNGRPTRGLCEGLEAHLIEEGWFGELRLDGLVIAARYRWPGPVHEGGGTVEGIIDERASPTQRDALLAILGGKEQEPTTVYNIYGATIARELAPVFAPITFACDLDARTGRLEIPGVMALAIEPIKNPVTGRPHRAQIRLPEGFEFREAEVASGSFTGEGEELGFANRDCYACLTRVAYGPYGIVEA